MKQQHKYRTQIKQRSITPSEEVWDKLSEKLSAQENLQKSKKWVLIKYAASILILISVGFYFFQPKNELIENEIIVTPTSEEQKIKLPVIDQVPEILITEPVEISPIISRPKIKPEISKVSNHNVEKAVVFQNTTRVQEIKISIENIDKSIVIEKENSTIVIASNGEAIDTEIEQLLNKANIKLKINRQNFDKNVVSANTLLLEVEDDLDKDFKQKLYESIVKSLTNLKEVVADNGN